MDYDIGAKLKKFRKEALLTQEKLAERANLSLRHIQSIEDNSRSPSIAALVKLAKILKKSAKDFF